MSSETRLSHHNPACYCTMCRDDEGNQHPIMVTTFRLPPCEHTWRLNQPQTAAFCTKCGRECDLQTLADVKAAYAAKVERWKAEGK